MAGFQNRKGCPNKITKIREQFGEAFERMGGLDALVEWGKNNRTSFYNMYARMVEKEIKTTVKGETHEDFIKMIMAKEQQRLKKKGKPMRLIDAPTKETPAFTVKS